MDPRHRALSAAFCACLLAACESIDERQGVALAAGCAASGEDVVCTEQGAVRGVVEGDTLAFKNLPYAKPPVAQLRWRPPQPAAPWSGIRDASQYGAICPQSTGKEVIGDEDCLSLNIWRSRQLPAKPLPVMVWLTGGGNHALSAQGTPGFGGVRYSGEMLAAEGVLFVSFNIRLGVLGFLAHPALDAERPERISGNYGSLDQIAMLRWLQRNIAAFGGDPKRVLLFGTSAGGGNICALMTSPLARGLFHAAAMQSSVPTGCEIQTLADAEGGTGKRVVSESGCATASDIAACLRGKSVKDIVSAVPGTFGVFPRLYGPNVDGHVFPNQPLQMIARGDHAAMPVIIGSTTDETMQFVGAVGAVADAAAYGAAIDRVFGSVSRGRVLATYPAANYPTPRAALVQLTTDAQFTCQSRRVATVLSKAQKQPVYRYLFAHSLENDPEQKALGALHTIEHPFFFPWRGQYRPTPTDLIVQQRLVGYWTRFARTGNPNGGVDPSWSAFSTENDAYLQIGGSTEGQRGPVAAHCDVWDAVAMPWPHL